MYNKKKTAKTVLVGVMAVALCFTALFAEPGVSYAADGVKLNKTSRNILTRKSYDFNVKGADEDAVITWSSSDESVATVDEDGVVTGVKKGTAKITCTVEVDGKTQELTAKVSIRKPALKIATVDKMGVVTALKPGKVTITATTMSGRTDSVEITVKK